MEKATLVTDMTGPYQSLTQPQQQFITTLYQVADLSTQFTQEVEQPLDLASALDELDQVSNLQQ